MDNCYSLDEAFYILCSWLMVKTNTDDFYLARSAKERKVRIWKDYVAPTANLDLKDRQFVAKVRSRSGFCNPSHGRRCVSLIGTFSSALNITIFNLDHLAFPLKVLTSPPQGKSSRYNTFSMTCRHYPAWIGLGFKARRRPLVPLLPPLKVYCGISSFLPALQQKPLWCF